MKSDSIIDIETDAFIGHILYLDGSDFTSGIVWASGQGSTNVRGSLYYDSWGGAYTFGGGTNVNVFAGRYRLLTEADVANINPVAVFG